MGPILKTLFGLFLFVWTVLGILLIGAGVYLAIQLPNLQDSLSQTLGVVGGAAGGGSFSGGVTNQGGSGSDSGDAPELDAETTACLEAELGKNFFQQLGPDKKLTEEQQAAMDKCGQKDPGGDAPTDTKASGSPSPKKP